MIYRMGRQSVGLLTSLGELIIVGSDSSTPWGPAVNTSIGTETTLGESFPECAFILTAGKDLVCLDDSIPSLEERRPTRLQLHTVDDKLNDKSISVLWNKRLGVTVNVVLAGSVEVPSGDGTVTFGCRGEEGIRESVLLDKLLGDNPEHLSPDFANGMYTPITWLVEGLVCRRVDGNVLEAAIRHGAQSNIKEDLRWSRYTS